MDPEDALPQPEDRARDATRRALAARIRAIEARTAGGAPAAGTDAGLRARPVALGVAPIDARLGGGLATGSLHEISGPEDDGAAAGFAAAVLAGFARRGPVIWIAARSGALHAPGLAALGLSPARLLVIEARNRLQRLWAFEEALRSGAPAAVLAELDAIDFRTSRRLQLAAAARLAAGLILDQGAARTQPSAARTRWRITTAPSLPAPAGLTVAEASALRETMALGLGPGPPRWRIDLRRAKPAAAGIWVIEQGSGGLRLAAEDDTPRTGFSTPPAGYGPTHADRPSISGALAASSAFRPARAG